MVSIKTDIEISNSRHAANIWKEVRDILVISVKKDMSTLEIDKIAEQEIIKRNGIPTFMNQYGFPRNVCVSVNEELIHGVPKENKILKNGDLVTIDMGVTYNGMIVDAAFSIILGNGSKEKNLINIATKESLLKVCNIIKEGTRIKDIGNFINNYADSKGFKVIKDFTGHGCGKRLHEDPIIPNYYNDIDFELKENMIICIEPMFMTDSDEYVIDKKDNWTVTSKNNKITCHWEHTILVKKNGCEILTL